MENILFQLPAFLVAGIFLVLVYKHATAGSYQSYRKPNDND